MEEDVGTTHYDAPEFGDEDSNRDQVYNFYRFWETFATMKQFTFVDLYDPRDAPNRRIKRLIENDNKKERNKERNRFNDKLKDLVAHIKKLDKRMQQFMWEEQ